MPDDKPLGDVTKPDASAAFAEMGMPGVANKVDTKLNFEAQDAAAESATKESAEAEADAETGKRVRHVRAEETEAPAREEKAEESAAEEEPADPLEGLSEEERAAKIYEQFTKPESSPEAPTLSAAEQRLAEENARLQAQMDRVLGALDKQITKPIPDPDEAEPDPVTTKWTDPAVVAELSKALETGDAADLLATLDKVDQLRQKELTEAATQPLRKQMEQNRLKAEAERVQGEALRNLDRGLQAAARKGPLHLQFVKAAQDDIRRVIAGERVDNPSPLARELNKNAAAVANPGLLVRLVDGLVYDAQTGFPSSGIAASPNDSTETTAVSGKNAGRNRLGKEPEKEPTKREQMDELFGKNPEGGVWDIMQPS